MILRALGLALSLIFAVCAATSGMAQVNPTALPAPLSETVSDYAGVLDATAEARIQRLIEETLAETGVEISVVTMPDIAVYGGAGARLDAYAKALFNTWGVGSAERNDGILMLVETEAREVRIALGAGYDAVYDGRAARVLTTAVLPELRTGQVAGAIEAGILSIRERLIKPFLSGQPVGLNDGFETDRGNFEDYAGIAGFGGIAGLAIFGILHSRRKRKTCPQCDEPTLTRRHEVIEPATSRSTGTGLEHLLCSSCGYTGRRSYTLRRSRSGRSVGDAGSDTSSDRKTAGLAGKLGGGVSKGTRGNGGGTTSGGGASGKY